MCTLGDYDDLELDAYARDLLERELHDWHDYYLPLAGLSGRAGAVLDVGAGCGETARFYLLHGATRVIAIEGDDERFAMLERNFAGDVRVLAVHARLEKVKIDIEGWELGMDLETHHHHLRWQTMRDLSGDGGIMQQRLVQG